MAKDYVISAVSAAPPREWSNAYGDMKSYKVKFTGEDVVVELNKKASSNPPQVGDAVYGDIQNTEYGYKFKGQPNPNRAPAGAPRSQYQPKDEAAIKAMWAIGKAVDYYGDDATIELESIETMAKDFYAMVNRVKGETVAAGGQALNAPAIEPSKEDDEWLTEQVKNSQPVDLSTIPF